MQITTPIRNITVLACLSLIVVGKFKDLDELAKALAATIQGVQVSLTKYPVGWRLQITGDNNAYPTDAHSLVDRRIREGLLVSIAN